MVQNWRFPWGALRLASVTCCWVHVSPPSGETDTMIGREPSVVKSGLKLVQQTYTVPKNGLDAALSAHSWSLSSVVTAEDRVVARTGGDHSPTATVPM